MTGVPRNSTDTQTILPSLLRTVPNSRGPQASWHQGLIPERQFFYKLGVGDDLRMIFIRSLQPRSLTSSVHSGVQAPYEDQSYEFNAFPWWPVMLRSLLFIFISSFGFSDYSVGKESVCNAGDTSSIPRSGRTAREGIGYPFRYSWVSLVVQLVKNLPAIRETWVWSLGLEDPLEKGKAMHSSFLT